MKYNVKFIQCHGDEEAEFEVEATSDDGALTKALGILNEELQMQKKEPMTLTDFLAEVTPVFNQ